MKVGYIVIGLVLLCCVLYYAYANSNTTSGLSEIIELSGLSHKLPYSNIEKPTSSIPAFTHSFFIYFKNGESSDVNKIMLRNDDTFTVGTGITDSGNGSGGAEAILLTVGNNKSSSPTLKYYISNASTSGTREANETNSVDIPIQKWIHITYIITEHVIETYKDGTLIHSDYFKNANLNSNFALFDDLDIYLGACASSIYLAKYSYYAKALNIDEITDIHTALLNEIGKSNTQDEYGLMLSLRKDGTELSNLFSI